VSSRSFDYQERLVRPELAANSLSASGERPEKAAGGSRLNRMAEKCPLRSFGDEIGITESRHSIAPKTVDHVMTIGLLSVD
jgi:hypothetical protein